MEDLLKRRKEALSFEFEDYHWFKIEGALNIEGGNKVKIYWKFDPKENPGLQIVDNGYIFILEPCEADEFDVFVHVPKPDNSSGKDNSPPIWVHFYELMTNSMVEKIVVEN